MNKREHEQRQKYYESGSPGRYAFTVHGTAHGYEDNCEDTMAEKRQYKRLSVKI